MEKENRQLELLHACRSRLITATTEWLNLTKTTGRKYLLESEPVKDMREAMRQPFVKLGDLQSVYKGDPKEIAPHIQEKTTEVRSKPSNQRSKLELLRAAHKGERNGKVSKAV